MTKETKVGLFILFGLIAFAVSIFTIRDIRLERGYRINIYFNEVAGLLEKAWVRVAGVKVGKVEQITLAGRKAKVTVWLREHVKLHSDAKANIVATGLLGVKYVELTLGSEEKPILKNGDSIAGIDPVGIDKLISQGMSGIGELSKVLVRLTEEGGIGENLTSTLKNINSISEKLDRYISEQKISQIVDNITDASTNLNRVSAEIGEITTSRKDDIENIIKSVSNVSTKLDSFITKIESGETTIGKLLSDKELAEDVKETVNSIKATSDEAKKTLARFSLFKTYWDYRLRHDEKYDEFRSDINLQIRPKPDKFYSIGVTNATERSKAGFEPVNTFNFNIGKDFGPLTVYGGIIRSTGGLGLGLVPFLQKGFLDRLSLHTEVYDFTREKPEKMPKINTGLRMKLARWIYLNGQMEDIIVEKNFNTSLNLVLEDEDIAYLLGLVGLVRH